MLFFLDSLGRDLSRRHGFSGKNLGLLLVDHANKVVQVCLGVHGVVFYLVVAPLILIRIFLLLSCLVIETPAF
jgi:hypothetical protein